MSRLLDLALSTSSAASGEIPAILFCELAGQDPSKISLLIGGLSKQSSIFETLAYLRCSARSKGSNFKQLLLKVQQHSNKQLLLQIEQSNQVYQIIFKTAGILKLTKPQQRIQLIKKVVQTANQRIIQLPNKSILLPLGSHKIVRFQSQGIQCFQTKNSCPFSISAGLDKEGEPDRILLFKTNCQLSCQLLVIQLMWILKDLFQPAGAKFYPYRVCPVEGGNALVEYLQNTITIDRIKKDSRWQGSLKCYFEETHASNIQLAREEFARSLAAYSLLTFVLEIKDRHNANILLHKSGAVIHIDFGYALGTVPGKVASVERAPFKLTKQYVAIMGGLSSKAFAQFKQVLQSGLSIIYKQRQKLSLLLGKLCPGSKAKQLVLTEWDAEQLIQESYNNGYTAMYDTYQQTANGIKL